MAVKWPVTDREIAFISDDINQGGVMYVQDENLFTIEIHYLPVYHSIPESVFSMIEKLGINCLATFPRILRTGRRNIPAFFSTYSLSFVLCISNILFNMLSSVMIHKTCFINILEIICDLVQNGLRISVCSSNKRRIIFFIIRGQDAHRAKNQQTFRSNKKRIILFVIQGQDAHRASINKDFKVSASLKRISTNFGVYLPHFQPATYHPTSMSTYIADECFGATVELLRYRVTTFCGNIEMLVGPDTMRSNFHLGVECSVSM
ncbi:hypothetical protein V1477_015457 [Vespula maculifrons]|uniref:Uncharacterized protein n=1 Tax=Vespula maculifrons TaxID=7453 RepID=A0ABD2BFW2_VESMC